MWNLKGTSISTWHKWDFDNDNEGAQAPHWYSDWDVQYDEVVERIAQDGSNSTLLHINYTLKKETSTLHRDITPDEENIEDGIQQAIEAGLQPILYPTIRLPDWTGSQLWDNTTGDRVTIQDPDQWFHDYSEIILSHAVLADKYDLPYLSIGCELGPISETNPEHWKELINNVKTIYDGPLMYSSHVHPRWNSFEPKKLAMYDDIDVIGFNIYLENGMAGQDFSHIVEAAGKPVMFTEVGFAGAGQDKAFQAFLDQWKDYDLKGLFAWDLAPAWDEDVGKLHHDIWDTKAQEILAETFIEMNLDEGLAPVYKFENLNTGTDFFTMSEEEAQIVDEMAAFESKGVGFYAHESEGTAVYRHFDPSTGIHSYENEINHNFYEGIAYFSVDLFG